MKVFLIDDCDYVAAETAEAALEWYRREIHDEAEEAQEASLDLEVNEAEDDGDPPEMITFAAIIERDLKVPELTWPRILGTDSYYL